MHIAPIGIDLCKSTFHLVAPDEQSKMLVRKKLSRKQLLAYTANLPTSLIGIEACFGAHFIGAGPRDQGHDVRLIPAHSCAKSSSFLRTVTCECRNRRTGGQEPPRAL